MKITMHDLATRTFANALESLDKLLEKAAAYAAEKDIDLINARLAPDMQRRAAQHGDRDQDGRVDLSARLGALAHFYFHFVTAYDILRHNGLAIGKLDFASWAGAFIRPKG